jgi:hypothetical protein
MRKLFFYFIFQYEADPNHDTGIFFLYIYTTGSLLRRQILRLLLDLRY